MRLIDADELERRIREAEKIFYDSEDVGIAIDCIDATKTISEWHYPSKGELPTESGEYLVLVRGLNGKPRPHVFEYYLQDGQWTFGEHPICWQYIEPPRRKHDKEKT